MAEAARLGVQVVWSPQTRSDPEASYAARPGAPGLLEVRADRSAPNQAELCRLLSHEMVHVLQHWRGQLRAITPLGWPTNGAPPGRMLSLHEAEAYTAQNEPLRVLAALRHLEPAQKAF